MTTTEYPGHIERWKTTPILQLANHFHCSTTTNGSTQHLRVHRFELSEDKVTEFTQIGTIDSMVIRLAIKPAGAEPSFTFYPILEITSNGSTVEQYFPFEAKILEEDGYQSVVVPKIFKDMVHDNWNKIDTAHIDDLFIAQARTQDEVPQLLPQMVRVHSFLISHEMVTFINNLNSEANGVANIENITWYPGVDMNKFGKKEYVSFAPVLGFTHLSDSLQVHSRVGILEAEKNETFIEYSRPCPPTCHD